jgi:hypothetical protein
MRFTFELWQDGIKVADVDAATFDDARREILHYASIYSQDGKVEIKGKHAERLFRQLAEMAP